MRQSTFIFIILSLSTVWAFEYGGQKYSAKDDTDETTESNDDLADAEVRSIIAAIVDTILDGDRRKRSEIKDDDEGPSVTTKTTTTSASASKSTSSDHTTLRNNIAKYVKDNNGSLDTKDTVPQAPRIQAPVEQLLVGVRANSTLIEPDIDDSLKVLSLEAKKKSDVMAGKTLSEELLEPPVMNLPMRPLNYTTASINAKQTIGEIGRTTGRNYNLTAQLEKESVESNSDSHSTTGEGSGSGDVTSDDVTSGSGETNKKRDVLDGSNVGRITKKLQDNNEVVPVDITERQQLMSKFADVDATGSGDSSGSGDVPSTKQSETKEDSDPVDDANSSGTGSGSVDAGANINESVRRRRSKAPTKRTFTVYNSPIDADSHPSYYTSNVLNVDNFGVSEDTDSDEDASIVRRTRVAGESEEAGSTSDLSSGNTEGSGSGGQRSKVESKDDQDEEDSPDDGEEDEEEDEEDQGEEGENEGEEEEGDEEEYKDDGDGDDDEDEDEDAANNKQQARSTGSGSGATEAEKSALKAKNVRARSVSSSGEGSGFSESGDFDATNGFSGASGESDADNYGDIGPDYKAYNKRRNTATRRGMADRSPIVAPRNDHVSFYKDSPPDDVLGLPDTREMGSVKVPENQLSNVKGAEKGGEALSMVTTDDTAAGSGNGDGKTEANVLSKDNSTKRDGSEKTLSEALNDIAFTNKSHEGTGPNGFHNDTVHIYLNKDGKVHNTTSHKQFLDNHKDKASKVKTSGKASAVDNKNKKNITHSSLSKETSMKDLKSVSLKKKPEENKQEKAHAKDTQEKKEEGKDDNNEKAIATIEAELADDAVGDVNKVHVNETKNTVAHNDSDKSSSDEKSVDNGSDYIKDAVEGNKDENKKELKEEEHKEENKNEKEEEEEEKDTPIAGGNVVKINVNNNAEDKESDNATKNHLKNDTTDDVSHHNSIHLSIYPSGKISLKAGREEDERMKLMNSTLQRFEPHDSERAHIDIAKIKNEDGTTTEVEFYHNKSGLYESDKHYNDVDMIRNHSFFLSENGTSSNNRSLYQYLHTNKWMMNETRRKNGPLSESSYAYLDQGEGSNTTSDEIIKKLVENKNFAAAEAAEKAATAANLTSASVDVNNATNSNLNETESGENLNGAEPVEESHTVKEMIHEDKVESDDLKGNTTVGGDEEKGEETKDETKEEEKATDETAANNNDNNNNNNQGQGLPIDSKVGDPFQAMIASIGPGTTTLNGIGNFTASSPEHNENNGAEAANNNDNNNSTTNDVKLNDEASNNSTTNIGNATVGGVEGAGINWHYDTQLALGDKLHDGSVTANNAIDAGGDNMTNNATSAESEAVGEDAKKEGETASFQGGIDGENATNDTIAAAAPETDKEENKEGSAESKPEEKDEEKETFKGFEAENKTEPKISDFAHLNKNPGPNNTDPMVELHKILSQNDTNDNSRYEVANETEHSANNDTESNTMAAEGAGVEGIDVMNEAVNSSDNNNNNSNTASSDTIDSLIGQLNSTDLSTHTEGQQINNDSTVQLNSTDASLHHSEGQQTTNDGTAHVQTDSTSSDYPSIPNDPFNTMGGSAHAPAGVIFNHMEAVNRSVDSDIQYNHKPIDTKNKELSSKSSPKKAKKDSPKKGVDVKVYSSGVTNVYVDKSGNVDVKRVDKKNTTIDGKNHTVKVTQKSAAKNPTKNADGLDEDLMKEEPAHLKEEPKVAETATHEQETTKKESVKSEKDGLELNLSGFEKAKIGEKGTGDELENDTNVYIDSKLITKNTTAHAQPGGAKNTTLKTPGARIKTFGLLGKGKSGNLNKTTQHLEKNNDTIKLLSNGVKNSTSNGKPKLKFMSTAIKNKLNSTATAKEKQGSSLFAKPKEGSLLKAASSKTAHNEKKKNGNNSSALARNISASDVSRSALTIVEDLVDIINSTHGKNKKNNTNPNTNEKTAKGKITRYMKAAYANHAALSVHPKRTTMLRHRSKKGSLKRNYRPVSSVKRDALETGQDSSKEGNRKEEDELDVQKRADIPTLSHVNAPYVEEISPRSDIPTPYDTTSQGYVAGTQQGYIIEPNTDPVTIEEIDPVSLESIRKSEIPDEYTAVQQQQQPSSSLSMTVVKKSEIPEVVEPMVQKKGDIPAEYLPEQIEPAVGMMSADIAPEHVSAEAQHLQNIKKGQIASEYISEAVQPQADIQAPSSTEKHYTTRAHIPAKDRTRKVRMNELARATATTTDAATNGGNNVETGDENRGQYLEKRDKIWTDDLDDIEGVSVIEDNEDIDDSPSSESTKPEGRSNIMNMLSASENTISSSNSIASVGVPDSAKDSEKQAGSADERQEAESGSGSDISMASGEDSGSADSTDENTQTVNTKRDTIARPYPITTSDLDMDEPSETTQVSKRNDVELESNTKGEEEEDEASESGSAEMSGSGTDKGSAEAVDEVSAPNTPKNTDSNKESNEARESIVKKLVNEMAHAAAGSIKERTKGRPSSRDQVKPRDADAHVVVKKSDIERIGKEGAGHEVVKRSSLSEEEIVHLSNNKDIHSALKMLVSNLISKGPGNGIPNEHLLRVKRMESEEKLEKDLIARSTLPRNSTLRSTKDRIVKGVRDLEGLGEELSQSDFLTPYKHDIIASKLEGDLLKNLKLDKEDSAIIYKEEDDLLKATEMEFIKDKIDREFSSNVGASREDKINAIKRTIKSLPLSKEDSDDLTKTIKAANWLGVGASAKKKSKLKPRHKVRTD